jgi:hypothetical protein
VLPVLSLIGERRHFGVATARRVTCARSTGPDGSRRGRPPGSVVIPTAAALPSPQVATSRRLSELILLIPQGFRRRVVADRHQPTPTNTGGPRKEDL